MSSDKYSLVKPHRQMAVKQISIEDSILETGQDA